MLQADDKIWDQNVFNELLQRQLGPSVDDDSGLVFAFDGKMKLGILPASIFCSGHTYFVQVGPFQLAIFNWLKSFPFLFLFFRAYTFESASYIFYATNYLEES